MHWRSVAPHYGVLEIDHSPSNDLGKPEAAVELRVWWGDGLEPTRAAWFWAGRLAGWVDAGEA